MAQGMLGVQGNGPGNSGSPGKWSREFWESREMGSVVEGRVGLDKVV